MATMKYELSASTIKLIKHDGDWIIGSLSEVPTNPNEPAVMRIEVPVSFDSDNKLFHYPKMAWVENGLLIKHSMVTIAVNPSKELMRQYIEFANIHLIGADMFFDDNDHSYKQTITEDVLPIE